MIVTGRWKVKFRFRLSFFRARTLCMLVSLIKISTLFLPIECTNGLHNLLFASSISMARILHYEGNVGTIRAVDLDSLEVYAVRIVGLEFGVKPLNFHEVAVAVLVLYKARSVRIRKMKLLLKCTSVYWPNTSISSDFMYWNSTKLWLMFSRGWK